MARRALLVGLNYYRSLAPLGACADDALALAERLERHVDGDPNFVCKVLVVRDARDAAVTRIKLRQALDTLFAGNDDVLFYFAGHGAPTMMGGVLCTVDGEPGDYGVTMDEVMQRTVNSKARDITLILDCCHSGDIGNAMLLQGRRDTIAVLRDNVTVIAASLPTQEAFEENGRGVFTAAVLDALDGGAADHMGNVSAAAVYAYVDRRLGGFDDSRPIYKSHASRVAVLRECAPLIERLQLRRLPTLFPLATSQYSMDPEFEPEDEHGICHEPVNAEKVEIAQLFKDYRDAGLLKPSTRGEQLYWTARRGHAVELTARGREYHGLVVRGMI